MTKTILARLLFLVTAITSIGVVPIQVILSYRNPYGEFQEPFARAVNSLFYFTNQTNILIGVVCLLLFRNIQRNSLLFSVARLTGFVSIVVVAIVYWLLIAPGDNPQGLNIVTNYFVHSVNPALYVIGWIAFGPRKLTSATVIKHSLIFPIIWVVFTMIKGPFVDYYPYNFLDVRDLGYLVSFINILGVTILFLGLFVCSHLLDKYVLSGLIDKVNNHKDKK